VYIAWHAKYIVHCTRHTSHVTYIPWYTWVFNPWIFPNKNTFLFRMHDSTHLAIIIIHMLMLVPLCTCAWACTTRCVNVYKQHCEWWRSRCVNVCKPNCEWWRSRKSIYICFHMLWSTCRRGGVLGIFSDIQKNSDNDLHVSKKTEVQVARKRLAMLVHKTRSSATSTAHKSLTHFLSSIMQYCIYFVSR